MTTIGERAWRVEWTRGVPLDESGCLDRDAADEVEELYASKSAAMERARAVVDAGEDFWGQVEVVPVVFSPYDECDALRLPHVGFWEPAGYSTFVERDLKKG